MLRKRRKFFNLVTVCPGKKIIFFSSLCFENGHGINSWPVGHRGGVLCAICLSGREWVLPVPFFFPAE